MDNSPKLSAEADSILNDLRKRIRSYVFWEGLALVIVVVLSIFWISFVVDWVYFRLSHLELPKWFRASVLVSAIALVAAGAFSWIVVRFFRGYRTRSLALVLERRFPQLDDRLITAVEAAEGLVETDSPVTSAMLQRTLGDVARAIKQLDVTSVFDQRPLRRAMMVAVALVASILGLMVVDLPAMERWVAGYINLKDGYWPRETELIVRVVVQPGDQIRDFVDGQYKHPKGGDLALVIEVPSGKAVPDRIRLDSRMGRGLTQIYLTPSPDHLFRHTFTGLIEDARIWVSGGDYSHITPFSVEVVPPPEVKQIVLDSIYPEYTGLNQVTNGRIERTPNELKGSQISLPMQTDFILQVTANKPLNKARIEGDAGTERWEIEIDKQSGGAEVAQIVLKSQDGKPQKVVRLPPLATYGEARADEKDSFAIPFVLMADGATRLPEQLRAASDSGEQLALPLPLPPDGLLRIVLEDTDRITSPMPTRFTVNAIRDEAPVVETRLRGIGTSITRKARIPIVGTITDDYGLATAQFEFKVDDNPEWQSRPFVVAPTGTPKEFTLQRSEKEPYERFDVAPLDLSIKQRLTLTVSATDACTVSNSNDPKTTAAGTAGMAHRAQGLKYVFTIIPDEELLSMLVARELGLRKRMEQIVSECKTSQKDLQTQQAKLTELKQLQANGVNSDDERIKTINQGLNAAGDRSLHGVRKNAVETAGVETAFVEIREELVNNAADTPAMLERLDDKILTLLKRINLQSFPAVDSSLGLFKLALDKSTDPTVALGTSLDEITTLIQHLEAVIAEMEELGRFDSAVEELKKMLKSETDLYNETKRKRKEKAIQDLE